MTSKNETTILQITDTSFQSFQTEVKGRITGVQPKQEFTRLINNHLSE